MISKHLYQQFRTEKYYVFINILCLVIGISTGILLYTWIINELSYDRFQKDGDRIYRLVSSDNKTGVKMPLSICRLYKDLPATFPEIEDGVYVGIRGNSANEQIYSVRNSEKEIFFYVNDLSVTDNFFSFFSYPIVEGEDNHILKMGEIAISKNMAEKMFPNESALGKVVETNFMGNKKQHEVVLVVDVPHNTHLPFDIVLPKTHFELSLLDIISSTGTSYVKFKKNDMINKNKAKELAMFQKTQYDYPWILQFQPLYDIHLHTDFIDVFSYNNASYLYLWIIITGLTLVLIVTVVNSTMLELSKVVKRTRNIAIKRIMGASTARLFFENMIESLIYTIIALALSLVLVWYLIPYLQNSTQTMFDVFDNVSLFRFLLLIVIAIPILLSCFLHYCVHNTKLPEVLNGKGRFTKGIKISNGISAFQVSVSAMLAIFTFIVVSQLNYMQKKDKGINTSNMICLSGLQFSSYNAGKIRQLLSDNPNIDMYLF